MSTATLSSTAAPGLLTSTNLFLFLLAPALALFYVYWKVSRKHMVELAERIPGPTGYPILGNALEFIGSPNQIFNTIYQRSFDFGRTIKVWVGPRLLIFLTDPRDVEIILSSHVHIDKSPEYRFFKPWLGDGLLISTGQKWRAHRKLIAPTFHLNVLKSFIDLFNKNSIETVNKMEKELGKEFDCHDYMSEATVEILLETAMGVSKKTQDQSGYDYAMAVMKLCDILHLRHTKLWFRPDIIFNLTSTAKYQENEFTVLCLTKIALTMSVELSKGALDAIMRGNDYVEPIIQVITTKKMNTGSGQPDKDRYRMFLSDGQTSLSFAMMTAATYNKAGERGLPRFSVIKVLKYITSVINNTEGKDNRVLLIVDFELVKDGDEVGEKLGDPVPFSEGAPKPELPKHREPEDNRSDERPSKMPRLINQANVSQSVQPSFRGELTHPISSLSPYQNKWVIKARVVSKGDIRTWSNSKSSGQLFSMDLADESGEIRCTAFGEMVDKYYNVIQVDKVYYITKCMLKPANKKFNTTNNDYEMTMTSETVVEECLDDNMPQLQTQYNFVPISKIAQLEPNEFVDIIGVAVSVSEVQSLTARTTGRELKKREIQLLDQSGATVALTLWGSQAESFDRTDNPVIALKGARVGEFGGGKNLSTIGRTTMKIDPDMKEAHQLQGWYGQEGANIQTTDLSARTGGVGGGSAPWMCLKEVVDRKLGTTDTVRGDFFQSKATVLLFRTENALYKACPTPECNKKVIDQDGTYRCEKCQKDFENFKYRFMCSMNIGDWSGNQWVSMFNDEAEKVLGMTADEAGRLSEQDQVSFREALQNCHFQEYILKCRAKMDNYRDEERLKIVAVRASPVNHEEYNSYLIRNIKQFVVNDN